MYEHLVLVMPAVVTVILSLATGYVFDLCIWISMFVLAVISIVDFVLFASNR